MPQGLARTVDDAPHARDALGKADKHRLAHEVVADIELDNLADRGDSDDIIVVEPVAGMDLEAETARPAARRR